MKDINIFQLKVRLDTQQFVHALTNGVPGFITNQHKFYYFTREEAERALVFHAKGHTVTLACPFGSVADTEFLIATTCSIKEKSLSDIIWSSPVVVSRVPPAAIDPNIEWPAGDD